MSEIKEYYIKSILNNNVTRSSMLYYMKYGYPIHILIPKEEEYGKKMIIDNYKLLKLIEEINFERKKLFNPACAGKVKISIYSEEVNDYVNIEV